MDRLLIANRGEIAVRVARTAADLGIPTVAVFSEDDARSLHTRTADDARPLGGSGPVPYLDADQLVGVAVAAGCDALHPGYGFLSENADFAQRCEAAGVVFVGPTPATLAVFGDKAAARALARSCGISVLDGTDGPTTIERAKAFLHGLAGGAVMVKAVAGGGGRGMRPVLDANELDAAFERCASEARTAFGNGDLYLEQLLLRARHVEVQILGDGFDVAHLWDRECSVQRNRQKVVEIAPAIALPDGVREYMRDAAIRLAAAVGYRGVGTIEFLVGPDGDWYFIEANARLQVEHTVTEEVTGLDLVGLQLAIADGASLADLALTQECVPVPRGVALQARINLESTAADGSIRPSGGVLTAFDQPSGPGVRVDTFGYVGYRTSDRFDSLLAKVVVHVATGGIAAATRKAARALSEFKIDGVSTNIEWLQNVLAHPAVRAGVADTGFVEEHASELAAPGDHQRRFLVDGPVAAADVGAWIDSDDPLAVLHHGKTVAPVALGDAPLANEGPDGTQPIRAPLQGLVVNVFVAVGDTVTATQPIVVLEAMKLEHEIITGFHGTVRTLNATVGATVAEGHPLAFLEPGEPTAAAAIDDEDVDLDAIRPDLAAVLERHRRTRDEARPDAVAKRHSRGQRTARENIDDLCDPETFTELSPLTVAARLRRNTLEELIEQTPADGFITGLGHVNGSLYPEERSRCAVMAYDATVLAGTQGANGHVKLDRLVELAERWRLPTVFFTEGGGGRPGDTDATGVVRSFEYLARLSGAVPLIGVTAGRCFAGNVAMLGCCDVIIATRDSILGMGGPAAVEGGGLGVFRPEEIGPVPVMQRNGVIDVLVDDEAAAVATAKQYLSYFQGAVEVWECADQRLLRRAVPENRLRGYDMRVVIDILADTGSVLELRPEFGRSMITAFIRVEGRPLGVIANNPRHLAGAVDSDASDKAARLLRIAEAFDIPVLSLSDTPGNMVGPEAEKTGLIRHCARLFVIGANLTVPLFSVIVRKSYGLGGYGMIGGSPQTSLFCVSWPTGEFGGMGIEAAIKLSARNELAAITDPVERRATFDNMVARAYVGSTALARSASPHLVDDVIDPADTRRWIGAGLRALPPPPPRTEKKLRWIDSW